MSEEAADDWRAQGEALLRQKRYDEALAALEHALALDPDNASTWTNKGLALGHLKRHDDELAAYEQALALDPNEVMAWNNRSSAGKVRAISFRE
jgi:Flp pilus assembly protein TadD